MGFWIMVLLEQMTITLAAFWIMVLLVQIGVIFIGVGIIIHPKWSRRLLISLGGFLLLVSIMLATA